VNRNVAMQENSAVFSENEQLKSERENLKSELLKLNEHRQKIEQTIRHEEANMRQKIEQEIEKLESKRNGILAEIETVQADKKSNELNDAQRFMLTYVRHNPNASYAEIGQAIGRAPSTVGKYATELESLGLAHKNGNGWEVSQ
jgi:chromosome segregation ATPase